MSENWDLHADGWDSNKDVVKYSELAFESLSKITNLKGLNILDFGCGTGLLTEKLSTDANHIVSLDSSEKMISVLKNKNLNNVSTITTELSKNTIENNDLLKTKFDLIVASSVFAFLPNYEKTLSLLKTLLSPGGRIIQWDWLETEDTPGFGFTKIRIESALRATGLKASSISEPFTFKSNDSEMKVIMCVSTDIE